MFFVDDELSELSFDEALDRIEKMRSPEEQAQALIRHSYLTKTRRGAARMRKVAAQTTSGCQHLFEVEEARCKVRAEKKAAADLKKAKAAKAAANRLIMPSLFKQFK